MCVPTGKGKAEVGKGVGKGVRFNIFVSIGATDTKTRLSKRETLVFFSLAPYDPKKKEKKQKSP